MLFRKVNMIHYKFSMLKDLEQLQVESCLTDTCVVGASSKVFADHVQHQPHSVCVWYQLDPGEVCDVIVIVPDATMDELVTFARKLYCQQRKPTAEERAEYRANGPDHDAEVKFEVKDEVDDDADNNMNMTQELNCQTYFHYFT